MNKASREHTKEDRSYYDRKDLRKYLILSFLAILVCVVVAEYFIFFLTRSLLLPLLRGGFQSRMEAIGVSGSGAGAVLQALEILFFAALRNPTSGIRDNALILILFFTILALILLPPAIGIVIYSRLVDRKVDEIERKREEEHERFDEKRNLLFADIAHDLRTPMTTVSGYSKAMRDGMITDEREKQDYLDKIVSNCGRMSELLNVLMMYTKLDSAGFSLDLKQVDLHELLLRDAAALYPDMEKAGMEFSVEIPEEPCRVTADPIQLSRVFTNLLVNAMRHNPSGTKVILSAVRQAGIEFVIVQDSGRKITGDPDRIFEPFVKEDEARSAEKGSGLGLSIAKKIIEMHGWRLRLQQPFGDMTKAFIVECGLPSGAGDPFGAGAETAVTRE
ncbi:MAG: sensor histidine kinase [Bilifractor sp.]